MKKLHAYILIYLTLLICVIFDTPAYATPFKYSEKGCDFAVSFPRTPTVSNVSAGSLEVHEAELKIGLSLLRAVCLAASNRFADDNQLLKVTTQDYFVKNGMVNASVTVVSTDYGKRADGRGFKKINGVWTTYVTVWCVTRTSVLTLTAATFSDQYPTTEISAFINSIKTP